MGGGVSNSLNWNHKSKTTMDRNVYICQNIMTGQSYHLNGYVKVTYIFDFGKKIRRGKEPYRYKY